MKCTGIYQVTLQQLELHVFQYTLPQNIKIDRNHTDFALFYTDFYNSSY